jgi:predicted nucleic acid-binding protein
MGGMTEQPVVVCDASVALAWLQEESVPAWVPGFWDAVAHGRVGVRVPTIFWLEVGNRLVRRVDMADEQVLEAIVRLEDLGFQTIDMDRPLRLTAVHLARQFRLSTYDALYLALADTSDLPLAALDGRLVTAAAALGRRYDADPRSAIGETDVSYGTGHTADLMSLAALGAYLAELRPEIVTGA